MPNENIVVKASYLSVFIEAKHCLESENRAKAEAFLLNAVSFPNITVYKPKSNCFFCKLFVYSCFRPLVCKM